MRFSRQERHKYFAEMQHKNARPLPTRRMHSFLPEVQEKSAVIGKADFHKGVDFGAKDFSGNMLKSIVEQ